LRLFRRGPIHKQLGRALEAHDDARAPWDNVGIHGLQRAREWDEVVAVEADLPGERASFVVEDDEIVIEDGPDDVAVLADAISIAPPFRVEAVKRGESVWAVAARRVEIVSLPGVEGDELELTQHGGARSLRIDGHTGFGSIPALEREGDFAVRGRRLDGDRWEIEASLL
jgi:hypothetical protein